VNLLPCLTVLAGKHIHGILVFLIVTLVKCVEKMIGQIIKKLLSSFLISLTD
jgi:hypothetical protein